jgi:iron(III) transport system substrate-binding protein
LTAGHPPKTWQDLIDPRYKGVLILGDPRTVPSYMALAHIWRQKLGDDFLKKLAAQQPVWVASVVSSTQQLAAGELPIVAPNVRTVVTPLKNDGAPIDFIEPSLTTGVEFVTAVSKTTESPNAARCLFNFLFTKPGQVAFALGDSYSPFGSRDGGPPLPTEYVSPVAKVVAADAPAILALLGLQ